jgi:hypothetical protein
MLPQSNAYVLARCNGYSVVAGEEVVGAVATPVFSGTNLIPDYLLVRVDDDGLREVPPDAIAATDARTNRVYLSIGRADLARLPEG